MNIFELGAFLGIFAGAIAAYHFVSPYSVLLGVLAAGVGAVAGFFIGYFAGIMFVLPFGGAARLRRFITTGRWTNSTSNSQRLKEPPDRTV